MNERNETNEKKLSIMKDSNLKLQKDKDQIEISLNNKIEILQYKLLNGTQEKSMNGDADDKSSAENTFKELLQLCKGDMNEIIKKLQQIS